MPSPFVIPVHPPIAGVVRKYGFQQQEPYTSIESTNFWPFNVWDGRRVSSTRPPLAAFYTPGTDVNLLCPVNGDGTLLPQSTFLAARAGILYRYNGMGFTQIDSAFSPPAVTTGRPVYATPFNLQVVIANDGQPLLYNHTGTTAQRLSYLTASAGAAPYDCRVVAAWQGAVWFAGAPAAPHILFGSRVGDVTDFNYAALVTDEGGAFATTGQYEGLISEPIVALMPHTADTMVVGCTNSMWALRGHPRQGGSIENLSAKVGPMGQGAWAKAPGDLLFILTKAGMMVLSAESATPAPISRERVPDELVGLAFNPRNPVVSMAYDTRWNVIRICVRGEQQQAWIYDLEGGGFHKDEYASYPTVMLGFPDLDSNTTSGVLFGGSGYGGLARFDAGGTESFNYRILAGPIKISPNATRRSSVQNVQCVFGVPSLMTSGDVTTWVGYDGEETYWNATLNRTAYKHTTPIEVLTANGNQTRPRLAGHAMILELSGTNGPLVFEGAEVTCVESGKQRRSRILTIPPEVYAGVDQAVSIPTFPVAWNGYATATPDNPASTLMDFTFLVDLAAMPAGWWSAVSATGSDIRVTTSANALLPMDLIAFNKGATTGFLAFKMTKTTSGQAVRIWARSAGGPAITPDNAFGQYNAYDSSWRGFWPDGGSLDRTVNQGHLTISGATAGGASGPIGNAATTYDGSNDYAIGNIAVPSAPPLTLICWGKTANTTALQVALGVVYSNSGTVDHYYDSFSLAFDGATGGDPIAAFTASSAGAFPTANSSAGYSSATWHHAAGVTAAINSRAALRDGANKGTDATSATSLAWDRVILGAFPRLAPTSGFFAGEISLAQMHNVVRADAWLAYQAAMGNQTTFWNGWTFV